MGNYMHRMGYTITMNYNCNIVKLKCKHEFKKVKAVKLSKMSNEKSLKMVIGSCQKLSNEK